MMFQQICVRVLGNIKKWRASKYTVRRLEVLRLSSYKEISIY